jgi:hypothetical protein
MQVGQAAINAAAQADVIPAGLTPSTLSAEQNVMVGSYYLGQFLSSGQTMSQALESYSGGATNYAPAVEGGEALLNSTPSATITQVYNAEQKAK